LVADDCTIVPAAFTCLCSAPTEPGLFPGQGEISLCVGAIG
jgi:hypothetical protein